MAVVNGYTWDKLQNHMRLSSLLASCARARRSHLRTKRCQPSGFIGLPQLPLSTNGSKNLTFLISTPTRSSSQALQRSATLFEAVSQGILWGSPSTFRQNVVVCENVWPRSAGQWFLTPKKSGRGLAKTNRITGQSPRNCYADLPFSDGFDVYFSQTP